MFLHLHHPLAIGSGEHRRRSEIHRWFAPCGGFALHRARLGGVRVRDGHRRGGLAKSAGDGVRRARGGRGDGHAVRGDQRRRERRRGRRGNRLRSGHRRPVDLEPVGLRRWRFGGERRLRCACLGGGRGIRRGADGIQRHLSGRRGGHGDGDHRGTSLRLHAVRLAGLAGSGLSLRCVEQRGAHDPGSGGRGGSGRSGAGDQRRLRDGLAGHAGLYPAEPSDHYERRHGPQRERAGGHDDQRTGTARNQRDALRLHAGGHADRLHPDQRMHADRRRRRLRPERRRAERVSAGSDRGGVELHPDGERRLQFGWLDARDALQLRDPRQLRGSRRRRVLLQHPEQLRARGQRRDLLRRRGRPVHVEQLHVDGEHRGQRRRSLPLHAEQQHRLWQQRHLGGQRQLGHLQLQLRGSPAIGDGQHRRRSAIRFRSAYRRGLALHRAWLGGVCFGNGHRRGGLAESAGDGVRRARGGRGDGHAVRGDQRRRERRRGRRGNRLRSGHRRPVDLEPVGLRRWRFGGERRLRCACLGGGRGIRRGADGVQRHLSGRRGGHRDGSHRGASPCLHAIRLAGFAGSGLSLRCVEQRGAHDPGGGGRGDSGRRSVGDQRRLRDRNAGNARLAVAEPGGDHQRHCRAQRERAGSHGNQRAGAAGIQRGALRLHAGGHADRLHPH